MVRNVILHTATSLDGYIARPDGKLDWVIGKDDPGYREVGARADLLLVGRRTCERILTFGEWPYSEKRTCVFTRRPGQPTVPGVDLLRRDPCRFLARQKNLPGGDVWLLGGCELNSRLLQAGLIDRLVLSVHPVFFGDGIPLFDPPQVRRLRLTESGTHPSGVLQLHYEVPR